MPCLIKTRFKPVMKAINDLCIKSSFRKGEYMGDLQFDH
jgi:hypothetical protein